MHCERTNNIGASLPRCCWNLTGYQYGRWKNATQNYNCTKKIPVSTQENLMRYGRLNIIAAKSSWPHQSWDLTRYKKSQGTKGNLGGCRTGKNSTHSRKRMRNGTLNNQTQLTAYEWKVWLQREVSYQKRESQRVREGRAGVSATKTHLPDLPLLLTTTSCQLLGWGRCGCRRHLWSWSRK